MRKKQNKMDKVKIKRIKRPKKKTSTQEKIVAGFGLASTLAGGLTVQGGSKNNPQSSIVAQNTNTQSGAGHKAQSLIDRYFKIPKAQAQSPEDDYGGMVAPEGHGDFSKSNFNNGLGKNFFTHYYSKDMSIGGFGNFGGSAWPSGGAFGGGLLQRDLGITDITQTLSSSSNANNAGGQVPNGDASGSSNRVSAIITGSLGSSTNLNTGSTTANPLSGFIQDQQSRNGLTIVQNADGTYSVTGGSANINTVITLGKMQSLAAEWQNSQANLNLPNSPNSSNWGYKYYRLFSGGSLKNLGSAISSKFVRTRHLFF